MGSAVCVMCGVCCMEAVGPGVYMFPMLDQNCVIMNWNVRGLNNSARRKVVKDLTREKRATVACLQETKLEVIDKDLVTEILGDKFVENFVFLPASGTRGGILLAVDEDYYKLKDTEIGVHTVTATVSTCSEAIEWSIKAVYGPQEDNEKLQFLGELRWI